MAVPDKKTCEQSLDRLSSLTNLALSGEGISADDAIWLFSLPHEYSEKIMEGASLIRETFRGNAIDPCTVMNAKSGACGEDCHFCSQSSHHSTISPEFEMVSKEKILQTATLAVANGARRFCVATSGRGLSDPIEVEAICQSIETVRKDVKVWSCATLGILSEDVLEKLKDSGLNRLHHNLETSKEYFGNIVTTHQWEDRVDTIKKAQAKGISVCSGGIFGLGESEKDRVSMLQTLRELNVDSIPLNFLVPIPGTPLYDEGAGIGPEEALRSIAVARYMLPTKEIRITGGRVQALGGRHPEIFRHGADGVMIGNYLTRMGRPPLDDIQMIKDMGHTLSKDPLTGQMPVDPSGSILEINIPVTTGQISFVNMKKMGETCD
ncbi:biotin synthase BioB [Leptospirillum ferrooxidans]|uniref:Biotin synthase n=1 Tax=Leptospirillum ferrooxidans (strain C2-3) TaxID=1162668 RepID=I0IN27_LEPFC|nr:biotin synthase BioB [Leptospirillum ferrooxidans]BAM06676.1 putative biotin synthetase [Leptospirillum ferrooxidans C2-3]